MKTVTILGAAGRIGEVTALSFLAAGWQVRGVARGAKLSTLPKGVMAVEADAMDQQALIDACGGSDVIIHALNPTYDKWETMVMPLARNVIAAAKANDATIMLPGNVYNYGTSIGMMMDEEHGFSPDTSKGKIRVEMETLFANAAEDGLQTIILRAGDFFGGKRLETWLDLMILKDIKKGKFVWPGCYKCAHAFAYLPDFADAFVRVAEKRTELTDYSVFHFAGHTLSGNDMRQTVESILGKSVKAGKVPWKLLWLIGLFNPFLKAVVEMSYLWRIPHSLNGDKLADFIDLSNTPIEQALRQTIRDQKLGA